jgi:hypothetical protein
MAYQQLRYTPGVVRDVTRYGSGGSQSPSWWETDKVRFRFGYPEKIGGWIRTAPQRVYGHVRTLFSWSLLNGDQVVAIGSDKMIGILTIYGIYDITPIRVVHTMAVNQLHGVTGTTRMVISWPGHGMRPGEVLTIQNPGNAPGTGAPTQAQIQGLRMAMDPVGHAEITVPADQILVDIGPSGSPNYNPGAPNFPNATPFGTASTILRVYGSYQTPAIVVPLGWGSGAWGGGNWGQTVAPAVGVTVNNPWTKVCFDNFGQQLIGCRRMGPICIWDPSYGYDINGYGETGRAVAMSSLPGANGVPDIALEVLVSEQIRIIIAFGVKPIGGTELDPMLFRWCDRENYLEWVPSVTNAAGELRLSGGSRFVTAVQTRHELLAWTDRSLCGIQFIGGDQIFGMDVMARGVTIAGPSAKVVIGDQVFWMGLECFYVYTGQVTVMACPLQEFVFAQLSQTNAWKTTAAYEPAFGEIKFFYCEGNSTEPNRYVLVNLHDQSWAMGYLIRTAWLHSGRDGHSIGAGIDDYLYTHEMGSDDGSATPPAAIPAYATSSPTGMGNGDQFTFVRRMIPDVTFRFGNAPHPKVTFILEAFNAPGDDIAMSDDSSVVSRSSTSTISVEQHTQMTYPRLRGRTVRLTIRSDDLGVSWRMGAPRIDVRSDGKRA